MMVRGNGRQHGEVAAMRGAQKRFQIIYDLRDRYAKRVGAALKLVVQVGAEAVELLHDSSHVAGRRVFCLRTHPLFQRRNLFDDFALHLANFVC